MTFPERDVRLMIAELAATRERVCELIRVRELASLHKLEQMRRVQMLGKHATWKREGGFDRIEIIVEIHEHTLRRLHAGFDLEPLYTGLYNSRWPPISKEFTPEMPSEAERLKMEILLPQPPPRRRHMIYRRDGLLRLVRGWINPEYRML